MPVLQSRPKFAAARSGGSSGKSATALHIHHPALVCYVCSTRYTHQSPACPVAQQQQQQQQQPRQCFFFFLRPLEDAAAAAAAVIRVPASAKGWKQSAPARKQRETEDGAPYPTERKQERATKGIVFLLPAQWARLPPLSSPSCPAIR